METAPENSFIWLPPFLFYFFCSIYVPREPGNKQSPPAEPHAGGRHRYDGVLPGAPKGSLATLPSPPQCHAALSTIPHTLASVDQSLGRRPKTLPPLRDEDANGWILGGTETVSVLHASCVTETIHQKRYCRFVWHRRIRMCSAVWISWLQCAPARGFSCLRVPGSDSRLCFHLRHHDP
jgi:hypothetical protein